jgi:hypothetical protein
MTPLIPRGGGTEHRRQAIMLDRHEHFDVLHLLRRTLPIEAGNAAVILADIPHRIGWIILRIGIDAPAGDLRRVDGHEFLGGGDGVHLGLPGLAHAALGISTGLMQPSSLDEKIW